MDRSHAQTRAPATAGDMPDAGAEPPVVRTPRWVVRPPADPAACEALCTDLGVPPLVAALLVRRGLTDPMEAAAFLEPRLEHLHDPFQLKGMDGAVARIVAALRAGERIVVSGDYDVDGISSTALLTHFLRAAGAREATYFIPNRFDHGYGLTPRTTEALLALRPALVVTVDNGITAIDEVARLQAEGIDTVVTDHHLPRAEGVPPGIVVNPVQPGCPYPDKRISGCGVAFKLITALRKRLRDDGWWSIGRPEPNLKDYLDLVAIATVADVVPLLGENRVLVHHGLQVLNRTRRRLGVQALLEAGSRNNGDGVVTARTLGFQIGPRLNAAGRMTDGALAVELLLGDDPAQVAQLAARLEAENDARRAKGDEMYREALRMIEGGDGAEAQPDALGGAVVVASPAFHEGIIGIVASRLVERYHRPALVLAENGGSYKGSARSVPGVHVTRAIAGQARLLQEWGGHAGAAGCKLPQSALAEFRAGFQAACAAQQAESDGPEVLLDAVLRPSEVSEAMVSQLERLEPYGQDNEEPAFLLEQRDVARPPEVLKERHLKWRLLPGVDMVAWNRAADFQPADDLWYRVRVGINEFKGRRTVQFTVQDVQPRSHVRPA